MRQLNNKQFDTKEGASASHSEIVSSQLAPSVSQKDEKMKKPRQLTTKTVKKGVGQMIRLQDGDSNMGWIYLAYHHNGSVQVHQKFEKGDKWECIMNVDRFKIGFSENDAIKVEGGK